MKTPEQIASDIVGDCTRGSTATIAEVLAIVRDAINADRAQRGLTVSDPDVQADLRQIRDRSGDWRWVLEDLLRPNEGESE